MVKAQVPASSNTKALILLFIANTVSGIAQGVSMIAIPWYFTKNGMDVRYALIYAFITFVSMFWGPYSGVLIDKYNRRKIFIVLSLVCGSLLLGVSLIGVFTGELAWYWAAFVLMVTFLNYNVHYPAMYAFVQEITTPEQYGKVTSWMEVVGQSTTVMAGAVGALLIEGTSNGKLSLLGQSIDLGYDIKAWALHEIFLLDASTYGLALLVILAIRYQPLSKRNEEVGGVIQRLKTGWDYLSEQRDIAVFGVLSFVVFAATIVTTFYLSANYVEAHLQLDGSNFASGHIFYAFGAIFAGAAIQLLFRKTTTVQSIVLLMWLGAGVFFTLFLTKNIYVFFVMMLLLGISNAGIRVQRITYLFRRIPNHVFGRASGIFFVTNVINRVAFLMIFALPFFGKSNNVIYAFLIMAVFLAIIASVIKRHTRHSAQKTTDDT